MNNSQIVIETILEIASEFNEDLEYKIDIEKGKAAPLFGRKGVLDSLGLVSFITAVEQAIEDKMDIFLSLADERAMSQYKSPFKTIGTLTDYVVGLMHGDT